MNEKYHWLNKHSRTFLERDYLKNGLSPEERIKQITKNAEKILGIKGFAEKFEDYMSRGFYSLSSPVWANYGNDRGLPVSCFGSALADTMESILEKNAEVGIMSKNGGGTSGYFGELRPRGAQIGKESDGGESSGPVHFMELYDKVADVVSQGATRRGSFAAYLPVEHPDIEEFLQIRSEGHAIQNMSIGVTISDKWMEEMTSGDKLKRKIWGKIIQKRFESGYPYIIFSDTVNNNSPQVYKDKGLKIKASNLCVTGETLIDIFIDKNEKLSIQIKDLPFYINKYSNIKVKSYDIVKNCIVYSEIIDFAQIGESTEIIEIEDEKGNILKCTSNHQIYTKNRGYVEAKDLKEDDVLEISN